MNELHEIIIQSLNRLEDKVDKIQEDTQDIKITQTKNTSDIEYHIKRTDLLESIVNRSDEERGKKLNELEVQVRKFGRLDDRVKYTIALVSAIGAMLLFLKSMGII